MTRLEFDVVEVDTSDSEREAAVRAFQSLAATAGGARGHRFAYARSRTRPREARPGSGSVRKFFRRK